jgi:hypothetical protein
VHHWFDRDEHANGWVPDARHIKGQLKPRLGSLTEVMLRGSGPAAEELTELGLVSGRRRLDVVDVGQLGLCDFHVAKPLFFDESAEIVLGALKRSTIAS